MIGFSADLRGKVGLVTGASSGLGRHFAGILAKSGAAVVLAARRLEVLKIVVADIVGDGSRALAVKLDVTSSKSVRHAIQTGEAAFGPIDILVNSAGITTTKPVLDQSEVDWDAVLNTNLRGAFLVATEVARRLREAQQPGSIINIASILGVRQAGLVAPYAVSKAGVIQLTKILALELAQFKIRVNALVPGYFTTELNRAFFNSDAGSRLVKRIPARRLGSYEDLDGPLLLLASGASQYMTGATLVVDGGHLTSSL